MSSLEVGAKRERPIWSKIAVGATLCLFSCKTATTTKGDERKKLLLPTMNYCKDGWNLERHPCYYFWQSMHHSQMLYFAKKEINLSWLCRDLDFRWLLPSRLVQMIIEIPIDFLHPEIVATILLWDVPVQLQQTLFGELTSASHSCTPFSFSTFSIPLLIVPKVIV